MKLKYSTIPERSSTWRSLVLALVAVTFVVFIGSWAGGTPVAAAGAGAGGGVAKVVQPWFAHPPFGPRFGGFAGPLGARPELGGKSAAQTWGLGLGPELQAGFAYVSRLAAQLKLTDEQYQAIVDLRNRLAEELKPLREEITKTQRELAQLWREQNPDRDKVLELSQKLTQLRLDVRAKADAAAQELRALLTPEQQKTLDQLTSRVGAMPLPGLQDGRPWMRDRERLTLRQRIGDRLQLPLRQRMRDWIRDQERRKERLQDAGQGNSDQSQPSNQGAQTSA